MRISSNIASDTASADIGRAGVILMRPFVRWHLTIDTRRDCVTLNETETLISRGNRKARKIKKSSFFDRFYLLTKMSPGYFHVWKRKSYFMEIGTSVVKIGYKYSYFKLCRMRPRLLMRTLGRKWAISRCHYGWWEFPYTVVVFFQLFLIVLLPAVWGYRVSIRVGSIYNSLRTSTQCPTLLQVK